MSSRRILVTSALPYANGDIHIGHLVEYIQTDIWVRFQKLRGENCRYFCADDTHGTAITISAKKKGVSEEEFIAEVKKAHIADFSGFGIEFDNYGSTHSPQTRHFCNFIWAKLREAGLVAEREIEQLLILLKCVFFLTVLFAERVQNVVKRISMAMVANAAPYIPHRPY